MDAHVKRAETNPFETQHQVDYLSCVFVWALRQGNPLCDPDHIKNAVRAIVPLWEVFHFGIRHYN